MAGLKWCAFTGMEEREQIRHVVMYVGHFYSFRLQFFKGVKAVFGRTLSELVNQ